MASRRISPQTLEELRHRVDLPGLVSRHVALTPSGKEFRGRCPFHEERTPSFFVVPEKGFFFCHGCRARGDAVDFLRRMLGLSFGDAVRQLAREVGLPVSEAEDAAADSSQRLRDVTRLAQEHFQALLWSPEGALARAYLEARGVTEETARAFGLGWAPDAWDRLTERIARAGLREAGLETGLVRPRKKGAGCYDFFRGRLMLPLRSPDGRPVGFGGRLMPGGAGGAKYLNSKDSPLYHKADTLFGMDLARAEIRKLHRAVLVEGYFDCVLLHQVGVRHAVALCSTHLTPGHLQVLARAEARELVLLLDGDSAGLAAVERLSGPLLAAGVATHVALLPHGEDPDTFALREGGAGVSRLLEDARPLTRHLFTTVLPEGREASFEAKMLALGRLRDVMAKIPPGLMRTAFLDALSAHVGLPSAELEGVLTGTPAAPVAQAPSPPPTSVTQAERGVDALEARAVACVLRNPSVREHDVFGALDHLQEAGLRMALGTATTGGLAATGAVARALAGATRTLPKEEDALVTDFRVTCCELSLRRLNAELANLNGLTRELRPSGANLARLSQRSELLALRHRVLQVLQDLR
ncbi:DNA primase [Corallococcus macrosporus]|uniref:DNA primase n=1 Tax=Corallococcus macrosporus TaxID=35 RepID=A0ABS3D8M4_9BACT|nr:DNA primase [Corallococcus macrosporus]MBN8227998.1 DNA primase [Corallococcus macrosporus]